MKLYRSFKNLSIENITYDEYYSLQENDYIKIYNDCLYYRNINNAMKVGKNVEEIIVRYKDQYENFNETLYSYLYENRLQLIDFLKNIKESNLPDEFQVKKNYHKGVRIFNPFYIPKPIKTPKKWTLSRLVKAIMTGQIYKAKCDKYLTDDYYQDYINDFRKGEKDILNICKEIYESPLGWKVRVNEDDNGIVELSVNCYSYNYNTMYYNYKNKRSLEELPYEDSNIAKLNFNNVINLIEYRKNA